MKNYTIQIRSNEGEENVSAFSAHCVEWDITADHESVPETLEALFSAIALLEHEKGRKPNKLTTPVEFVIPAMA